MPLPFSHIYYANKIKEKILKDKDIDEQDFFIGSTFPDIRYVLKKDRQFTHLNYKNSAEILEKIKKEKNSFELGVLCHLYTDYKFMEYWNYFKENNGDYYPFLILENELLFDKFNKNKQKILEYFNKTDFYNATQEEIEKWHDILKQYLSEKMNKKIFKNLSMNFMGAGEEQVNKILERYEEIKDNKELKNKIENFEKKLI
jgi:hypothetical protein